MKLTRRQLRRIISEELSRALNEGCGTPPGDVSILPGQPGYDERTREENRLYHAIMEGLAEVVNVGDGKYYDPPSSILPDLTKWLNQHFEFKHTSPANIKPCVDELLGILGQMHHNGFIQYYEGVAVGVKSFERPRSDHRYGTKVFASGDLHERETLKPGEPGTGTGPYLGPVLPRDQERYDQDGRQIR